MSSLPWEIVTSEGDLATVSSFFFCVENHLHPDAASRGLISRSWHCFCQIFMRSSACEGNIPLNRQLPANAHWLIWNWGEGNYTAISLNLKPRYVCEMIVQYGLLMVFYYAGSIYDIILGYSPLLHPQFFLAGTDAVRICTLCVCVCVLILHSVTNEAFSGDFFKYSPSNGI